MGWRAYAIGPVMDGYSVQETASVLGVPEGRVWELLARGVLSGTPEGDSMRVFLKAEAGPIATAGLRDGSARTNGNGGSHEESGAGSAFRELLTEFRNLTERYGQALLALGEARGEVAGLRSRVELLEARLDLRLAAPLDATPIAWESPPAPATVEAVMPTPEPIRRATRPRKGRSTRAAVAGFAEALARAQDPTLADLGGTLATGGVAREAPASAPETGPEAGSPSVVGPSEPATAPGTYSAEVVEPDWFADGDFAWLDAADIEALGEASVPSSAVAPDESTPERDTDAEPTAEHEPEERDAASEMEIATEGWHAEPDSAPAASDLLQTDTWPAADAAQSVDEPPPPLAMTEEELARLARDEGWDDAEVAVIRGMISPPPPTAVALPGAAELDEAMAALDAIPVVADVAPSREWAKPSIGTAEPIQHDDWAFEAEPVPPSAPARASAVTAPRSAPDAGWERRRGPAAAAYRRLRRLFRG